MKIDTLEYSWVKATLTTAGVPMVALAVAGARVIGRHEHFAGRVWFGSGRKKSWLCQAKKIPPMTVPLDELGLIFWAELGPRWVARIFYSVK